MSQADIMHLIDILNTEKELLTIRLDRITERIASAPSLLQKVKLKLVWIEDRRTTICRLTAMISTLNGISYERSLRKQLYDITVHCLDEGSVRVSSWFSPSQSPLAQRLPPSPWTVNNVAPPSRAVATPCGEVGRGPARTSRHVSWYDGEGGV